MHERAPRLLEQLVEPLERPTRVLRLQVDRSAVAARGRDLCLARTAPHDDERVEPLLAGPQGDRLRVVPRRDRDDPRAFSSALSEASFVRTPRGLKEPVFWSSSALRNAPGASEEHGSVGVRWRRPVMTSRARSTSSRLIDTAAILVRASECGRGERRGAADPARRARRRPEAQPADRVLPSVPCYSALHLDRAPRRSRRSSSAS